ncbi:MAG: TIGR04141 family sporadically distributed protein [Clostridia bacterium]|nr:TIGR04141 family sporadically distributed protein [Clostridia bacterium]
MATKEVGIYLINKGKFEDNLTNEEIVSQIKTGLGKQYQEISVLHSEINGYNIKLYNKITDSKDTWGEFWNCIDNGEKIVTSEAKSNNYIAFIYKDNNLFCVTTNKAYHDITRYIVSFFGVCIMSYFIKDEDKIRSASYTNIMSNFLGGSEYLGEDYQTAMDKYWDRINTSLMAELKKERVYAELGLEYKRKHTNIRFDAKDNFTICSKLDLNEVIQVIEKLDIIANDDLIDKFNTIERIKEDEKKKELEEKLISKIFSDYQNDKLDLCIVHKNMEKHFGSTSFVFKYKGDYHYDCPSLPNNKDLKAIFDEIGVESEKMMKDVIDKLQLISFNSEEKTELSDNIKAFLNTSIIIEGKEYLVKNKEWYKLSDNYIKSLDEAFKFIQRNLEEKNIDFKEWTTQKEGKYIELYEDVPNFYKLHPKTEDGIEVCDLLYINREREEVELLFLKKGFGANTRELAIQAIMGTKRLLSITKDSKVLNAFYNKYIHTKTPDYTFEEFERDIKKFTKTAVMVYKLPKSNKEKSNIGKQSVIYARNEIDKFSNCRFMIKRL